MADSRIANLRLSLRSYRPQISGRAITFIISIAFALGLTLLIADDSFSQAQTWTLFLIFFAVSLWMTEAVPPFAVSILVVGFLVYTQGSPIFAEHPVSITKYINTWSSPVILLILGGFFLAKGMEKTRLDYGLFAATVKIFGTRPRKFLLGLMLTTAIGSMLMSNTATTAIMIAAVTPFLPSLKHRDNLRKALLLGIPAAASVGGMGTIIGSPPNAIAVGALNAQGIEVDFLQWMFYGFPAAIGLTLLFWFILIRKFKIKGPAKELDEHKFEFPKFKKKNRPFLRAVLVTIFLTLGLWLTSPLHGISVAAISGIPILLLTVTGVINADDVRTLPWDTLMLIAGGLALGIAIVDTGLAGLLLQQVQTPGGNVVFLILFLGILTAGLSNIMSNTAAASILIPVAILMLGDNVLETTLVISLCASTALLLPISTPPNAIAFSTGFLKQKDFRTGGIWIGLLGPVVVLLWVLLLV